ncbi:hypothetical protein LXL04_034889 [Taraxacum kok-saghyz]
MCCDTYMKSPPSDVSADSFGGVTSRESSRIKLDFEDLEYEHKRMVEMVSRVSIVVDGGEYEIEEENLAVRFSRRRDSDSGSGFDKPSDHGQLRDGETQTRASHRIYHGPKDYLALGVGNCEKVELLHKVDKMNDMTFVIHQIDQLYSDNIIRSVISPDQAISTCKSVTQICKKSKYHQRSINNLFTISFVSRRPICIPPISSIVMTFTKNDFCPLGVKENYTKIIRMAGNRFNHRSDFILSNRSSSFKFLWGKQLQIRLFPDLHIIEHFIKHLVCKCATFIYFENQKNQLNFKLTIT